MAFPYKGYPGIGQLLWYRLTVAFGDAPEDQGNEGMATSVEDGVCKLYVCYVLLIALLLLTYKHRNLQSMREPSQISLQESKSFISNSDDFKWGADSRHYRVPHFYEDPEFLLLEVKRLQPPNNVDDIIIYPWPSLD